ncbi:MAG: ABC transporter substrate-binding protein [Anaerolineae bacterium]
MFRLAMAVLVLLSLLVTGCSARAPAPESVTIRFYDLTNVDVRDVPMLMALDALREQGYTIEVTYMAKSALIAEGLARGDADIGLLNNQTMWLAIEKGADVRTVAQSVGSATVFASKTSVTSCQQLDGRPVGLASATGVSPALLYRYLEQECPDVEPQYLVIPESEGRRAAMLADQLDATTMPSEELLKLQQEAPGRFHALMVPAEMFPEIQVEGLHVRQGWAQDHPEAVRAFLRALLEANRRIAADPQLLYDQAEERLELDATTVRLVADAYLDAAIWPANGALTSTNLQQTIDFLTSIDELPAGLEVDDIADLSYLNAVLDEIGRR